MGHPMSKVGAARKLGRPASQVGPLSPTFGQSIDLAPL
jgi:hypothetical protein